MLFLLGQAITRLEVQRKLLLLLFKPQIQKRLIMFPFMPLDIGLVLELGIRPWRLRIFSMEDTEIIIKAIVIL
jgi:hypothetical protein